MNNSKLRVQRTRSEGGRKKKPLPIEINKEEFRELMQVNKGIDKKVKYQVAFTIAWGSGLRISEVVNLNPEDFNFKDGTIRVNEGKNSKDRIVPIPKGLKEFHLQWIPIGVGTRAIQKEFEIVVKKCGLKDSKPKVHFHSLRHGFATECLRSGMKLPHIQMLMGHEDLATTAIYLNLVPKEALDDYNARFLHRE